MKVLGRIKYAFGAIAFILATTFSGAVLQAHAEETTPKRRIQLTPARFDLKELEPGETTEMELKVQNTGSENFKYELSIEPFSVSGETYNSDFSTSTNYTDIVKWITFSQTSGEIEPSGQDVIKIKVKVPDDVPAGGQYAAVVARMLEDSASEDSNITTIKQVASILYTSVAGTTRKEGSVVENKVPSFMFAPPISATSIVENKGNVHAEATYILQVYPLFGDEEIYTNEESPETHTILPETRRLNTITWDGAPHLGIFKVKQTVKFLDQTSVSEKVLFICPIWFLLIVLAVIFLAIFWIITRMRGRKE